MLNTITLKRVFAACTALVICASSLVTPAYADETTITAATVESDAASTCTISFDTAGGSYVASQTINAGAKITKPQDPTQKGMTFLGWFMNPYNIIDGVTTVEALKPYMFNFDSEIYGSFTLTALWGAQLNLTATEGGEVTSCFIDETLSYAGKKTAAETAIIGFYDTFYIGAKASDGYKFSKWQEKHADGSYEDFWNESEVFMTMNKTLELVAIFEEIGKKEEEQPKQPEEPTEPEKPEEPTEPEKP
ncbi:MAG: InlB B-repeat-containing protein, partial [Clostridia bacterium]|nr:InlB B-repeat-containing protein [Clostridia bacterium]